MFLRNPQLPLSTLFAYTSLFRSESAHEAAKAQVADLTAELEAARERERSAAATARAATATAREAAREAADRKSTRLNSSHVEISYAVYCLKKKIYLNSAALNSVQ